MSSLFYRRTTLLLTLLSCSLSLFAPSVSAQIVGRWDDRFFGRDKGGQGLSPVEAFAMHPTTGTVFAGGYFSGYIPDLTYAAQWTGSEFISFGGGVNNIVWALEFDTAGNLYLGGRFTKAGDLDVSGIAVWDGVSWSTLGRGIEGGSVHAIHVQKSTGHVYVGGDFQGAVNTDGTVVSTRNIVKWNGMEWEAVGRGGAGGPVNDITTDPLSGDIFAGGRLGSGMLNADSTLVRLASIARWDGSSWSGIEDDKFYIVFDLEFDATGRLYVGHSSGFLTWNRTEWSVLGGGLPAPSAVRAIDITEDRIYLAGRFDFAEQSDGNTLRVNNVVAWDLVEERWESLGEGISRREAAPLITALLTTGNELFVGGVFGEAGGLPSDDVALWVEGPTSYPETGVTFRVDMRMPMRLGLTGTLRGDRTAVNRPIVHVMNGEAAGGYFLYDVDGDSVWTVTLPQPAGMTLEYSYAIDANGDGLNTNLDWIYELDGPDGARTATLSNAPSHVLPIGSFDDVPLAMVDATYDTRVDRGFLEEDPRSYTFRRANSDPGLIVDFSGLNRSAKVAVRWYKQAPSGEAPEGIAVIGSSSYWAVAIAPSNAVFTANLGIEYGPIPGISEPDDLRLLYRPDHDAAWEIVPSDINLAREEILAPGLTRIDGEWALGSISTANVLSSDPPPAAFSPSPSDGNLNAPIRPLLTWEGEYTQFFDVYLWESTESVPTGPTRAGRMEPNYQVPNDLVFGTEYAWKIVSRNINGETEGPTWRFIVGNVPDLTVTAVSGPSEAFSGQPIEVSWSVSNVGDGGTNAPLWYDEVFVSPASVFNREDAVSLGRFRNQSFLNPGETYANRQQVTLPEGLQGTRYLHVWADAPERQVGVMDEADESNNIGTSAPMAVTLTPFADLEVTSLNVQTIAFSGDSVTVTWTVENVGTGRTDAESWFDSIFLSVDETFDFTFALGDRIIQIHERLVGTFEHQGALQPGGSYQVSQRIKLPDEVLGEIQLFVYTDIRGGGKQPEVGDVYEFNQELDNWTGRPVAITLTPPPDLVVTEVIAPTAFKSGDTVQLRWTVENQGPGATAVTGWSDWVYYAPTPEFDPATAVLLGSFRQTGGLANDAAYQAEANVRVPDGVSGAGYFFVRVDGFERVFEHTFSANNVGGTAEPAQVTLAPYPDLQVDAVSVASSQVRAGQEVALTYEITNAGTAAAPRAWTDSVFVSSSPTWDRLLAVPAGSVSQPGGLAAGESRSTTVAATVPPSVSGRIYFWVQADATDDIFEAPDLEKNTARTGALTATAYPPVNLAGTVAAVEEELFSGMPFAFSATVTNIGSGATLAEGWIDRLYLSRDAVLSTSDDVLLREFAREGRLGAGASYTYDRPITLPDNAEGDYTLIFVSDAEGDVDETETSDNVATVPIAVTLTPPVDLRVTNVEAPASIQAGQPLSVTWTGSNQGTGVPRASNWFDAVYLSPDDKLDPQKDFLLGTFERSGGLDPGASYEGRVDAVAPVFGSGAYYLLVVTDQRNDVYEHLAEGNNVTSARMDLALPDPSDLVVTAVEAPASAVPGAEIEVKWTVANQGEFPARGLMRDAVFVSADDAWDPGDLLLGILEREIDLEPGASFSGAMKVDVGRALEADAAGNIIGVMPGVVDGAYRILVRTDIANTIRETDVANNTGVSAGSVETEVPLLTIGTKAEFELSGGRSRTYRLTAEEGTDLRIRLTADEPGAANELYVAFDRAPSSGGDFDFAAAEPFQANQELVVPATKAGTYFILVAARNVASGTEGTRISLRADTLGFSIASIEPSGGGQGQVTTTVRGAGFRVGDRILLERGSDEPREGRVIEAQGSTETTVRWTLDDAQMGTYDLVIERASGERARLAEAFTVGPRFLPEPLVSIAGPDRVRADGMAYFDVSVTNQGNVDIPFLTVNVLTSRTRDVAVHTALLTLSDVLPFMPEDQMQEYIPFDDEFSRIPVVGHDIAPGREERIALEFSGFYSGSMNVAAVATIRDEAQVLESLAEAIEFARKDLLTLPVDDPEFIELVMSPAGFAEFVKGNLADRGVLPSELLVDPDAGGVAPGSIEAAKTGAETRTTYSGPCVCLSYDPYKGCTDYKCWDPDPDPDPPPPGPGPVNCDEQLASQRSCLESAEWWCQPTPLRCPSFGLACGLTFKSPLFGFFCAVTCGFATWIGSCDPNWSTSIPRLYCPDVDASCDPNDMIGPEGFSDEKWVGTSSALPYTIRFENDPERATASAQVVDITCPLDPAIDQRSFRLGSFGFGSHRFDPPENVSYYTTRVDVTDSLGVFVDVAAGIDVLSNKAFWRFTTIDPATGAQPINDPLAGFLPVNDASKVGEGFVNFTVRADQKAATGSTIDAQASIIFDRNAPLDTPPIFNTLDATPPISTLDVLPWKLDETTFELSWTGNDDGSGIRHIDLYLSTDEGPFELYRAGVTETSLLFVGEVNRDYRFFTLATDNAGNREPKKTRGETGTIVSVEEHGDPGIPKDFALHQNFPNPFNPTTTIPFDLPQAGRVTVTLFDIMGRRVAVATDEDLTAGRYQRMVDLSHLASGVYFYDVRVTGQGGLLFRDTKRLVLVK